MGRGDHGDADLSIISIFQDVAEEHLCLPRHALTHDAHRVVEFVKQEVGSRLHVDENPLCALYRPRLEERT